MQKQSFEDKWRERFARFADQFDDDAGIAGWSKTGLETRIRHFAELWDAAGCTAGQWLDAGCGAGTYAAHLQQAGAEVTAFDFSLLTVKKGKQRYPEQILWAAADVTQLPLTDNGYDGSLCFGVSQALSSSESLINELSRVVKPGGHIWIDGLNSWCLPHTVELIQRKIKRMEPHLRYESPWRLRQQLRSHGLEDVSLHWLAIAPARYSGLQTILDHPLLKQLFSSVPLIGAFCSHSMILHARVPDTFHTSNLNPEIQNLNTQHA